MECNHKIEGDTLVIMPVGKIDSSNANDFENQIKSLPVADKTVMDFEKLEYLSSAGLRVLLHVRKEHPDLKIINVSSEVYEILDMTGFTQMIKVIKAYKSVNIDGCEVIGEGANGKVYRINPDTVVKVYTNNGSLEEIENERDVARKALVLGIPTAISYDVVKVGENYASMFELIDAKPFSKLLAECNGNVDEYAKMFIDLLKLIHSTKVPKGQLPDRKREFVRGIEFLNGHLPENVYSKLLSMVNDIPVCDNMIHGDYHSKNVMLQGDELILIDMDTLGVGHSVFEWAYIYSAFIGHSLYDREQIKRFAGFSFETSYAFWRKCLEYYYETTDKAILDDKENKAKVLGLSRLLRRCIRRSEPEDITQFITNELCAAVEKTESLI